MLEENKNVRNKIPDLFRYLMVSHLEKVDEVLSPGLTVLRWTSLNVDSYVESVYTALGGLEVLIAMLNDILEMRIEESLKHINSLVLCELPDAEPWTTQEFLDKTLVYSNNIIY